ncbi:MULTISPECIES: hypothetical protein [unclassified Clostridium]|nr:MULTISPECIES: hypothetical protein [unclassified Clostridium]EHI99398.1 hypothetical protein CDLVIII_2800 [Clostridium sp. DL-VIII]OOM79878.1 hypothetical protein CLOBL_14120 [Clostridium sp. BL-8]
MAIKNVFGKLLLSISGSMIKACTASYYGHGVEEMPESMKKLR